MKKILICLFCLTCMSVFASDLKQLPYKNINENSKIAVTDSNQWTSKAKRKGDGFVRKGNLLYFDEQTNPFDTGCEYLFVNDGRLVGYSASNLKFYEFVYNEGQITKSELDSLEVASLFKDFRVILISEFSELTNVYTFKKNKHTEKIIILNDTDNIFENYGFTSNNARFEEFEINNAIEITKKGMIQFSSADEDAKSLPWFIILAR